MSKVLKEYNARVKEALRQASAAYKEGDYLTARKILEPFKGNKRVDYAIKKIHAIPQSKEKTKRKPLREEQKRLLYVFVYLGLGIIICIGILSIASSPSSNGTNNPFSIMASDYYTAIDDVIVWTCARFDCERLVILPVGTRVSFIQAVEGEASPIDGNTTWYQVRLSDNREGFINRRVLSEIRPTIAPTPLPPPVSYPSNNTSNQRTWDCRVNAYNCSDLTCSEIASYMSACPNDPSNLDGDNDGEACEREC